MQIKSSNTLKNKMIHLQILGAGPAGMSVAFYAKKNNLSFKIFEKSNSVGGNCKTIEYNGFKFDTGAHRFHDKIPSVTADIKSLMGESLRKVSSPSKIFHNNKYINFPIEFFNVLGSLDLSTILKIISENTVKQFYPSKKTDNFRDFAYRSYGKTLADLFLINYTEKLWGISADKLLPNISGGRLNNLGISSTLREIFHKPKIVSHLDGSFYYPIYGFGTIFDSIKNRLENKNFQMNADITGLIHNKNTITHIIINNKDKIAAEEILCSLPITTIIKLLEPKPPKFIQDIVDHFSFRSLTLIVIMINKKSITENASIYFPVSNIPYTRIYEPKNRSLYMAPTNQTSIVVEVPSDQFIKCKEDEENLKKRIISDLIQKKFFSKKQIITSIMVKIPYAYPILEVQMPERHKLVLDYLKKFENLHLIGRNAEFRYMHTHEIFQNANKKINKIVESTNL